VPRGDPVDGIGIVLYPDTVPSQLVPESYRPRAGGRRRRRQLGDAPLQLLGRGDERLPDALPALAVERCEDLAAAGVEHREVRAIEPRLADSAAERIEGADAGDRQAEAGTEPPRRRDPDPQAGEGAGAEPDREQLDPLPAACRRGNLLDLGQQRGRVTGRAVGAEAQQRLPQDLAAAPGAGGGVRGRGVEADDYQGVAAASS
jgi:hypothetical protein